MRQAFIDLAKSKKRAGPQHDAAGNRRQVPAGTDPLMCWKTSLADKMDDEVIDLTVTTSLRCCRSSRD